MRRKKTPLHDRWHRRVEGQIKDTIHAHPKWFSFTSEHDKADCINSLAKRIVGEIVADGILATIQDRAVGTNCPSPIIGDHDTSLRSSDGNVIAPCVPINLEENKNGQD